MRVTIHVYMIDLLFPREIPCEAEDRNKDEHEVEDSVCPQTRNKAFILERESDSRGDHGVDWQEDHGEYK